MRFMHCCDATLLLFKRPDIPIFQISDSPAQRRSKPRGTAMFASIVRMIRAWRRYNQSLSELNRLGDRELADIGISRSDIPRIAWGASQQG
jgi:uncharacterized protein YjiS (DUF1127 family)